METLKRRSRMRRISVGKRIELTERDVELFKLLDRYHYLRSNFLYAFLGGNSETRFKERLGDLYHDGRYINRPEQQWQFANSRYMPVVYELDASGEQVLRNLGLVQNDSPLLTKGRMGAYRQFAHQLMICECMASIELGVRQQPGLRFISWREIMSKASEATRALPNPFEFSVSISHDGQSANTKVVPDGLFGLEYAADGEKSCRFFALEVDRNTMPLVRSNLNQTSYLKKLLAYRAITAQNLAKVQLGIPNLFVLTVTTNEQHMTNIMDVLAQVAPERKSKLFLFKVRSETCVFQKSAEPTPRMLTEPWQRVGYEPLAIYKM
jgi:hypothetical protein